MAQFAEDVIAGKTVTEAYKAVAAKWPEPYFAGF